MEVARAVWVKPAPVMLALLALRLQIAAMKAARVVSAARKLLPVQGLERNGQGYHMLV